MMVTDNDKKQVIFCHISAGSIESGCAVSYSEVALLRQKSSWAPSFL